MPIIYHQQAKEFHLYNQSVSYIIQIMGNGQLATCIMGNESGIGSRLSIFLKQVSGLMLQSAALIP